MPESLFDKLWKRHHVCALDERRSLIYIDRIFLHERTGSIALKSLQADGRRVANPSQVFCTMDHIVDTFPGRGDATLMPSGEQFISATREAATAAGIQLFDIDDPRQGIAHVVAAEEGIALPGLSHVCPDSHTCTLGGLGVLAWGIGSTEAEHAMATQTLVVEKPKTMRIHFGGKLQPGVSAKDLILYLIAQHGAAGGSGYAVEFAGPVIEALDVEARMSLCNMAVEFSAFTGFVAPDAKTIDYLKGRPYAPGKGQASHPDWQAACADWQQLRSDVDAVFDREIHIDCSTLGPQVSWGTNPQQSIAVSEKLPALAAAGSDARSSQDKALSYIQLEAGQAIAGTHIDAAFIGSCTNSRLSDLRTVAEYLKGKHIAEGIAAVCVPGSKHVKRAAEAEGIDKILIAAGFEWREPGCSMCFFAGGETFGEGKRVISSTNRNFEGRQGPKVKTHIASPLTVAASAVAGHICAAETSAIDTQTSTAGAAG